MKYSIYITNKISKETDSLIAYSKSSMINEVQDIIASNKWTLDKVCKIVKGEYICIFAKK